MNQTDQVAARNERFYLYDKYSRFLATFATGDSLLSCGSSAESGAAEENTRVCVSGCVWERCVCVCVCAEALQWRDTDREMD